MSILIFIVALQQRICAPLSGPESALPELPDDDDSWYYEVRAISLSF
jgi:hypothetical protein